MILALGESKRSEAVPLLEPFLRHTERKVRLLAIQSVGGVGGSRARALLTAMAQGGDGDPVEKAFARSALPPG
jgi:hypothetical protein